MSESGTDAGKRLTRRSEGGEVSPRAVGYAFQLAERKGLSASDFVRGTGCDYDPLKKNRIRVPWSDFRQMLRNTRRVASDAEREDLGRRSLSLPGLRPMAVIGRILITPLDLFRWGHPAAIP